MPPHARLRPPRLWSGGAGLGNTTFAVLLGYGLVSFLFFGLRPVIQPGRQYIGVFDDPQIPIWSFAWWPHAIAHGLNPFVTRAVFIASGSALLAAWHGAVYVLGAFLIYTGLKPMRDHREEGEGKVLAFVRRRLPLWARRTFRISLRYGYCRA